MLTWGVAIPLIVGLAVLLTVSMLLLMAWLRPASHYQPLKKQGVAPKGQENQVPRRERRALARYINVDGHQKRDALVQKNLTELFHGPQGKLADIQRFPAMTPSSPFTQALMATFPLPSAFLKPTESAVYASQVTVMMEFLHNEAYGNDDWLLIFEDDVCVSSAVPLDKAAATLECLIQGAPPNVCMFQMAVSRYFTHDAILQDLAPVTKARLQQWRKELPVKTKLGWGLGALAYGIRKSAIRMLVNSAFFYRSPIDVDLMWFAAAVNAGILKPPQQQLVPQVALMVDVPLQGTVTHGILTQTPNITSTIQGHQITVAQHRLRHQYNRELGAFPRGSHMHRALGLEELRNVLHKNEASFLVQDPRFPGSPHATVPPVGSYTEALSNFWATAKDLMFRKQP